MKTKPGAAPSASAERVALAARVIVGVLLIYSGLEKAAAPVEEFMVVISGFQILPEPHVRLFAHLIPWTELIAGSFFLLGLWTRAAAVVCGGLSLSFFFGLLSTYLRGVPLPNCGCFGGSIHLKPWQAMMLDAFLIACAATAWLKGPGRLALDRWAEENS